MEHPRQRVPRRALPEDGQDLGEDLVDDGVRDGEVEAGVDEDGAKDGFERVAEDLGRLVRRERVRGLSVKVFDPFEARHLVSGALVLLLERRSVVGDDLLQLELPHRQKAEAAVVDDRGSQERELFGGHRREPAVEPLDDPHVEHRVAHPLFALVAPGEERVCAPVRQRLDQQLRVLEVVAEVLLQLDVGRARGLLPRRPFKLALGPRFRPAETEAVRVAEREGGLDPAREVDGAHGGFDDVAEHAPGDFALDPAVLDHPAVLGVGGTEAFRPEGLAEDPISRVGRVDGFAAEVGIVDRARPEHAERSLAPVDAGRVEVDRRGELEECVADGLQGLVVVPDIDARRCERLDDERAVVDLDHACFHEPLGLSGVVQQT